MSPSDPGLSRRQLLAGGLGVAASIATGGGLFQAWQQLSREDLIPGAAPDLELEPDRWVVTEDQVSFVALGDNGSGGRQAVEVAEQMARSYQQEPFGTVSLLGDICYYGPISERFDDVFVRPLGPLIDAGVQFELAIGNHDGNLFFREGVPDVEATLERLGTPGRYYAVSRGPVDLFYLDSGRLGLSGGESDRQLAWLDEALTSASRPWRIVCLHHPLHSSGLHGDTERLRARLQPLIERHQVDLVLAGHDHHYERSVPIAGTTHVVSGAGCKLSPVTPSATTAVAFSTLQFLRVDVDGDRLLGRCIGVDGAELDRFELRAEQRP